MLRSTENLATESQDGKNQKNDEEKKYENYLSTDVSKTSIVKSNEIENKSISDIFPVKSAKSDDLNRQSESTSTSASTLVSNVTEKEEENGEKDKIEKLPIEDFSQLQIDIDIDSSIENIPSTGNVLSPSIRIPAIISVKLSPLEIFRAALDSIGVSNWSLFA